MNLALLKKLSDAPGISGREERVRDIVLAEIKGLFDDVTVDNLGNVLARKSGKSRGGAGAAGAGSGAGMKKVVIAAHMDEIGFYVKHIDEKGFLRLVNVGGFDTRNLLARRVKVHAKDGDLLAVMNPGGRPIHIAKEEDKKKIPEVGEFIVDTFLTPEEVKAKIRIGDPVTLHSEAVEIGEVITGKAMDDRAAVFVAIEALRKVKTLKYDVTVAFTVQEEVGLRGAVTAGYASDADIGIALDVTLACDTPGVPPEEAVSQFGLGAALTVLDGASIANRPLFDEFEAVAKKNKIPHQFSVLPRGGTDAGALQRARTGMRTFTLSIPTRNIHTVTEACHKKDLQAAIDLLAAWLGT